MAKINRAQNEIPGAETAAGLASLGLMCCMIVTLIGIKIWWFKHRLSFDQSSTSNGAVGGAQPQIVTRTRSTKDKKLAQQIREPVLVHGVFRKRQEDEIEIFERPKLLPPIREQKLSQSTPELFKQPKQMVLNSVPESEFLDIPAPPIREPPPPPIRNAPKPPLRKTTPLALIPRSPTPPIEDIKTTTQTNSKSPHEKFEVNTTEILNSPIPRSPTPPIFEHIEEIITSPTIRTTPSSGEPLSSCVKNTEFYSSDDEEEFMKAEKSNIHDDEHVIRAPKPLQRNKSHDLEAIERRYLRARATSVEKIKPRANLMERRATGFQRPDESEWQQFRDSDIDDDSFSNPANEQGKLRKWENLESYSDEILKMDEEYINKQKFNDKKIVFVDVVDGGYKEEEQKHNSTWTLKRRPTGYPNKMSQPITDLDSESEEIHHQNQQLSFDESNTIWLEMERDLEKDFASNVEEEFNKIRHSYEANEEGFLEESTIELDTGYGKSIEEDWENFEKLQQSDNKIASDGSKNSRILEVNLREHDEWLDKAIQDPKVHFNLSEGEKEFDNSDEEKIRSTQIRERRPTGFERNSQEIQKAMLEKVEFEQNNVTTGRTQKVSFQLSDEEDLENEDEEKEISIIKQRRPTGYTKSADFTNLEQLERVDDEDAPASILMEPESEIKPKPRRQKVTFNFTAQVREHEIEDDDDSLEDGNQNESKQPIPMQRTLQQQNNNCTTPTRAENSAALLFSTQVSAEYALADSGFNDCWSAIRLHRQLTDELQQLELQQEKEQVFASPKPVYRNPLAQVDTNNRREEENIIVAKPRTMRDMKKAQARQTMHVQHYDGSVTEA